MRAEETLSALHVYQRLTRTVKGLTNICWEYLFCYVCFCTMIGMRRAPVGARCVRAATRCSSGNCRLLFTRNPGQGVARIQCAEWPSCDFQQHFSGTIGGSG